MAIAIRVPELDRPFLKEESCKVSLLACISRTVDRWRGEVVANRAQDDPLLARG